MGKILKNVIKSSDKTPDFSSSMPLKERNIESAIKSISKNFEQSFYTEHSVAKSTLQFLVCCGAPDIDRSFLSVKYCTFNACKTRYGVELFNHLKNNPEDILKDPFSRRPVPDPDFLSIYLDLDEMWSWIYGLSNVNDTIKSLAEFEYIMNFNNYNKGITKELLHVVGHYMINNEAFIQTFISGTALQEVVKLKKPTSFSFNYINCPFLSMNACIEIVNNFAVKQNDINYQWILDQPFIKILDYDHGLPRAIEYILDGILKIDFFRNHIWNLSNFFDSIVNRLDMSYAITAFVEEHEDLDLALLKNSIVFKNAASAEFGDLFVRYVSADDDFADDDDNGYLFCLQSTLKQCGSEEIKKQWIITILSTTKAINPDLHYSICSAIPDDVLVVCRDNFHQHFGCIFGTALKDSPQNLKLKRPFHSLKDFKDRVAFKDRETFDRDEKYGINAKIGSRMLHFKNVKFRKLKSCFSKNHVNLIRLNTAIYA
ncbi:hypothetical protein RhiirA1_450382 [Rhizophagus irregularis]|uniref:Uncharacterized protein n=1 Tax=Rhizophagus irregularis TaxID=588596 RepID=A0A2N0SEZ8_9GLOM|nr:hypothetical protein RhiirA1_450382 [Rhizophagus irregularis]